MKKQQYVQDNVKFSRFFIMPMANTFAMLPCQQILRQYIDSEKVARWDGTTLGEGQIVIDPFSRISNWASFTNDLNPKFPTHFHMEAREFLRHLLALGYGGKADVVLLDPPYSPRQIKEVYNEVGITTSQTDTQNSRLYKECKDLLNQLLKPGGLALTWGWNSGGFGVNRGFDLLEVVLLCHGGAHNDTIITVERKQEAPKNHLPGFEDPDCE